MDSSVGGKPRSIIRSVKHDWCFYQPKAVVIDTDCLTTLPAREFAAGMAEVIKYGIIYDSTFFDWLEALMDALYALDEQALTYAIAR